MWTLKSSTREPSKTVRPIPSMPGVMSLSGRVGSPARRGQTASIAIMSALSARRRDIVCENRFYMDVQDAQPAGFVFEL